MSASRLLAFAFGLALLTGCGAAATPSGATTPAPMTASGGSGPQGNTPVSSERPYTERASSSAGRSEPRGFGARSRH